MMAMEMTIGTSTKHLQKYTFCAKEMNAPRNWRIFLAFQRVWRCFSRGIEVSNTHEWIIDCIDIVIQLARISAPAYPWKKVQITKPVLHVLMTFKKAVLCFRHSGWPVSGSGTRMRTDTTRKQGYMLHCQWIVQQQWIQHQSQGS